MFLNLFFSFFSFQNLKNQIMTTNLVITFSTLIFCVYCKPKVFCAFFSFCGFADDNEAWGRKSSLIPNRMPHTLAHINISKIRNRYLSFSDGLPHCHPRSFFNIIKWTTIIDATAAGSALSNKVFIGIFY